MNRAPWLADPTLSKTKPRYLVLEMRESPIGGLQLNSNVPLATSVWVTLNVMIWSTPDQGRSEK